MSSDFSPAARRTRRLRCLRQRPPPKLWPALGKSRLLKVPTQGALADGLLAPGLARDQPVPRVVARAAVHSGSRPPSQPPTPPPF